MSDSSGSIQSALCSLIETVEAATRKVVDQRKLFIVFLHSNTQLLFFGRTFGCCSRSWITHWNI